MIAEIASTPSVMPVLVTTSSMVIARVVVGGAGCWYGCCWYWPYWLGYW
ncbi:Uncharacterised protein [Mycobacteroides abscessus subsp. abscessus]|nr:Uncharacterised protein [Mycobacteroides abscessus subsp. abscessus]